MSVLGSDTSRGLVGESHGGRVASTGIALQAVPRDRVRWGPVLAGLFTAASTLALLAVLGAAIGFSAVDYGDSPRAFGIGAGIWTIVSVLIAFFIGGALSSYTAATPASHVDADGTLHDHNGLLQGAMVWVVTIPLSIYLVAGGVGSAMSVAGKTAATAAETASNVAGPAAADPQNRQQASDAAQGATGDVTAKAQQAADSVRSAVTPENVDRAKTYASGAAWGTLVSMLVGLAATSVGGLVGGKSRRGVSRAAVA